MKLRVLPLFLVLTTLVPMTAQAQRTVDPSNLPDLKQIPLPKDIKLSTTISGTITPENSAQLAKAFSNLKCQDLQVILEDNSFSPGSIFKVSVNATGKQVSSGCKFSLVVPEGKTGHVGRINIKPHESQQWTLRARPQGWQNPFTLPQKSENGRNFVVYLEPFIK